MIDTCSKTGRRSFMPGQKFDVPKMNVQIKWKLENPFLVIYKQKAFRNSSQFLTPSVDRLFSGRYLNQKSGCGIWLRGTDLNRRPSGYEPDELPDCSTPRYT